ncbi:MAG: ATP-dependent DNA ligase [Acidimicrobiales bacterium]
MLLADVVATSGRVAATRSRSAKVAALAELLRRLDAGEVETAVAVLTGEQRQGKIGVGWATIFSLEVPPAPSPTLTVLDLDAAIDELAAVGGPGSTAERQTALAGLLARATHDEQDFIRRLLIGDLRQGALAGVVTDGVAKAAAVPIDAVRRAAMLTGSLPEAAVLALTRGEAALDAVGLQVMRPLAPMLASTAPDVATALQAMGRSSVEWKLDGARVQAHRRGGEVRLFTRNLNDVTSRLPAVVDVVASLPVRQVVLDGEVVGLDEDDRPDRFQDTMSRFGRQDGAGATLTVAFFDCLHLDGADLLDRALTDRLDALERAAGPWRVRAIMTDDAATAAAFLEEALAAGHEGVMVNALGSRYEAGRRGQAWRKVKPVRTFDLVVLGAEWGHGRRQGWLSNLHLGARDPSDPGRFVMVGKTFKGMTDELLSWQTARLQELAVATPGDSLEVRPGHAVEVRPALVVEVALDGVQASTRYPGGVALRFARVRRYREDKVPAEADTIDDLRALLT